MDSNVTRYRYNQQYALNKAAFEDVIGDPFAHPEPIQGQYITLRTRSSIMIAKNSDEGKATKNPATPNIIDFFCDVERIVKRVLKDEALFDKFMDTYIYQTTEDAFTKEERSRLEQQIGKLFIAYKISPVAKYFKVIRK
jgi:hypothetical protein